MRAAALSPESFGQLHPSSVSDADAVRRILTRLWVERCGLQRALNRKVEAERAFLTAVDDHTLTLQTQHFDDSWTSGPWSLNAALDGRPMFFVVQPVEIRERGVAVVSIPERIYWAERRDRLRVRRGEPGCPNKVMFIADRAEPVEAEVADVSPEGIAIRLPYTDIGEVHSTCHVAFLEGDRAGQRLVAELRSKAVSGEPPGWQRIGLSLSESIASSVLVEKRLRILPGTALERTRRSFAFYLGTLGASAARVGLSGRARRGNQIEVVEYPNRAGETCRAIIDSSGDTRGAPAIVIPPAWGKTKETLLPLAATLVACFEAAGRPLVVLRFDGVRRRGESYNEPECRVGGREYHRFSFSQGVRDIEAALDFLDRDERYRPSSTVLVTFSAAAIDGRRAVAQENPDRIGGWISVVGAPDLQSAMRVVSGGVDYLGGFERGVRFGLQEVQGVTVDMDYAADDALRNQLAFLDDAKRDMAAISVPVTWIHGRHDAWMELGRVSAVMSAGDQRKRRLIEVPAGHQLRSSRQAIEVFQLIASEAHRMIHGSELRPVVPDFGALMVKTRAERSRLPKPFYNRDRFWRDYLLGRDGAFGIELMTETTAYSQLMAVQVDALGLRPGSTVLDLGSGTGSLLAALSQRKGDSELVITEVDCVRDALKRARGRFGSHGNHFMSRYVVANLDLENGKMAIPVASGSHDCILASLLLSYVSNPGDLLRECARVLRPGGRLVLSTLRPDADTSKIFIEGAEELRTGRASRSLGLHPGPDLERSLRSFLNDAARLLDLEETGVFRFWETEELRDLVQKAGLRVLRTMFAFGRPSQALVLVAQRG